MDDTKGNNQFIIMISRTIFLIVLIFVSCNNIDKVSLSLPPIFSDHMVLQQKEEILFWGNSEPNSKITIDASTLLFDRSIMGSLHGNACLLYTSPSPRD